MLGKSSSPRWLFLGCGCLLAIAVQAATWYVKAGGNDSSGGSDWNTALLTISNAVFKASAPDTILVSNGNYKLSAQLSITKGITLQSLNGRDVTIVDGNAIVNCVYILHTNAVVDGFTVTNGAGGAVNISAGLLLNCTISGNTTSGDGGSGVTLGDRGRVKGCIISNNAVTGAGNYGGAVAFGWSSGPTPVLEDSLIINNTSVKWGAGVTFSASRGGLVSNCTIMGNTGTSSGGGVYFYGGVAGVLQDCTIISNCAVDGGGISANGGPLLIKNCRILNNRVTTGQGGGLIGEWGVTLQNCLIAGNSATNWGGGGVCVKSCSIQNCTIVSNVALGQGGGLRSANIGTKVQNSIIYFNKSLSDSSSNYTIYIQPASFSNSCFAPAMTGDSTNYSGNNITSNPTLASVPDDCRLLLGSPCINVGTNQDWMTNAVDLNGRMRIRQGRVDIGAYEWFPKGTVFRGR